jgi:hypothetical protein
MRQRGGHGSQTKSREKRAGAEDWDGSARRDEGRGINKGMARGTTASKRGDDNAKLGGDRCYGTTTAGDRTATTRWWIHKSSVKSKPTKTFGVWSPIQLLPTNDQTTPDTQDPVHHRINHNTHTLSHNTQEHTVTEEAWSKARQASNCYRRGKCGARARDGQRGRGQKGA